ncbi:uncharacterized protein LOC6736997 [Drosophila simulans]|uniref:GD13946 n=1 Tax=Drosophila simulans TaxID=7240 RepID=B4QJC0_DROSI|nr:uncharacterized protein LOC6736997 [Drosophila simulans]EDX09429.1 GD13946 [Drosophila simulans]KMY97893.1 uncharacterized protein Dsimw501_GD13946, isoform A [Drosophila simulans]KMY97894.1 uncharacterized protein Dsimw501_GD13946, isoform B [Drosophila simulans]
MEQPDKEVQALEAEVKVLNTELALQNAGNRRNRLKREIAELEEAMEKQRIALVNANKNRKAAKTIILSLMDLNQKGGKTPTGSNSPSDNEGSSEDFDLDEE